ncbi:helix-turn-helix domain-containing protein [Massilia putida]|uniref:helix-turn-helix domain-containing protein n=1 Tax=Massilia putida TaxID=1141883 RepID=UPI000950DBE6|nr:helix-turn-helix domain-containing protein [Massilia putida]
MQDFYRKALLALILLLVADALIACFCIYRSYPSLPLFAPGRGGVRWHLATSTDATYGGTSTIRVRDARQRSLSFDFKLTRAVTYPGVSVALVMEDGDGKPAQVDLSRYTTVTFLAKCAPADSLIFTLSTFDESISKAGDGMTYPSPMTFFSCNEKGVSVSLDLTRLTIPQWWFDAVNVDLSRQSYKLDHVASFEFRASQRSRFDVVSHVEIGELMLHGRDYRYIAGLAAILAIGWSAFGIWFFRAYSRALTASLGSRLRKDLPFVAYRQLTLEPFKDKEKAAILRFIASNYTNPELDLEGVVAGTAANRRKINEVLKTELGMTFISYLNKLRLTEAARLLTDKAGATMAEIAYSVGYANPSYFNKLFKEEYGCTPKAFRSLATQRAVPSECDPAAPATQPVDAIC